MELNITIKLLKFSTKVFIFTDKENKDYKMARENVDTSYFILVFNWKHVSIKK